MALYYSELRSVRYPLDFDATDSELDSESPLDFFFFNLVHTVLGNPNESFICTPGFDTCSDCIADSERAE